MRKCECEQATCKTHPLIECTDEGVEEVQTVFGIYSMCIPCAVNLPIQYHKTACTCTKCILAEE